MKTLIFSVILFCTIAGPACAELTEADLNKIRLIIKEEIKEELKPIKEEITTLKADVAILKIDVAWIRGKLEGVDKQFASVDKQIIHVTNITYGLIALHRRGHSYPANHPHLAERKGSPTATNQSRTPTGNRSTQTTECYQNLTKTIIYFHCVMVSGCSRSVRTNTHFYP